MSFRRRAAAIAVVAAVGSTLGTAASGSAGATSAPTSAATTANAGPISTAAVSPGTYRIRNAKVPGYCLERDQGPDLTEGPLVGMLPCTSTAFQLWDVASSFSPEFYFVRARTGGCLDADVQGGKPTFVAHVIPCWGNNNPHQLWTLPSSGNGVVIPLAYSPFPRRETYFLDNSMDDDGGFGYRVNYWHETRTDNQLFSLERMG